MRRPPIVALPCLIFSSLFFFTSDVIAQDKLKDSKELVEKGIELYEQDKYKEALTYYLQVPEGDTNYSATKYEIALTYLADSAFERAKQVAFEGLTLPNAETLKMLYVIAHAYDYLGKTDSALYYYDSIARTHPVDNHAYYEKAVVYYRQENFDKAEQLLQQALMINPYHYRSHAVLGTIYMQQGRLTEAYMACTAALLFTSDINVARGSIGSLSAIARQTQEVSDYYDKRKEGLDLFAEIDEIVHAKLALNKGYNVRSVMNDDQIIRVAHAIMEKLSYDKDAKNFAMQYYVPLFQEVYKKDLFDPFMLLMFSNYGIDVVDQYAKKQKRDISEVKEIAYPYWDKLLGTRTLEYNKRENMPLLYSYDQSGGTYLAGNLTKEDGKIAFREGKGMLYRDAELIAEGNFNNGGKKEGMWRYYHPGGALRLTEMYKNGVIQGEARAYRKNGFLSEVRKYNSKGDEIEEHEYTYNGTLDNITFVKSEKETEVVGYHPDGHKQTTVKIKDGKLMDGKYRWVYPSGAVEYERDMEDGKLNGEYKEYYENGKLRESGTFRKGDREGMYTTYYENGKKESEGNYNDGKLDGERVLYNEQGQVTERTTFRDGKRNGMDISLSDEKEYYTVEYKNDVPVAYMFKGADGKEIKDASKRLSVMKVYWPNGNLRSDLPLKDGKIHGKAKYYFSTGSLREAVDFEDDERNGTATEYYKSGKVSIVSEYIKGERTGWYKGYHANGKLRGEGWLIDNKKEGVWRFYNVAGKLESEAFYLNDQANGPSRHYNGNGKINFMDYYDRDLITRMEQYDGNGKIIHEQVFPLGTGRYYFIYPNGNPSFEAQLKNGNYEGAYTYYYPDKSIKETGFYKNGDRDSLMITYFPGGQESGRGNFRKGMKEGTWVHHTFDGKLERETGYAKGDEHGKDKIYLQGELRSEYNMNRDYMDGDQLFYGEENKIALVNTYKGLDLVGYSYAGKDGKLQPVTPVKNGTAKITTYYPNGNKAVEKNVVENKTEGKMTVYFSNGNVAEEMVYASAELNGPYKRYFHDGKPSYETTYTDDALNGEEKLYTQDGKLLVHANYVMDDKHGPQIYNDPKTGKTYKLTYEYGLLLTMENL